MWNVHYEKKNLTLDVELTTHCNIKCPQCSRTNETDKLNRHNWVPLTSVSIEQFKTWFPLDTILYIKNFHFSGTYGDPGMCKDLYKILEYIIKHSFANISLNTNGSMRDSDFWWDVGALCKKRITLIFDVDGIDQKMHNTYRRGSNLEKVLDAIEAVSMTPAKIRILTVLFKHNEDYLEQIRDMVQSRAYKKIEFDEVEGNNFQKGPTYYFVNEEGETEFLQQVTREDRQQGLERLSRRVRDHRHIHIAESYDHISCLAAEQSNLKITATGQVSPCCYISTSLERASHYKKEERDYPSNMLTTDGIAGSPLNPTMRDFVENKEKFNLNHTPFKDIINNGWFTSELQNSWEKRETACFACAKVCGKKL